MKFSWRTVLLWTFPLLIIGFFLWQGSFANPTGGDGERNVASSRMTYGRFLNRLDAGQVTNVDFYDGGRTAIIQAVEPELGDGVLRARVDLPGNMPELISSLKDKRVSFDIHPPRTESALWGLLGNLIFPVLLLSLIHISCFQRIFMSI